MKKILVLYLLFSVIGCKKEMDELNILPPATQTGAGTFGCLVNGKAWVPDNGCILLCPQALKFYYYPENGGEFSIKAVLKNTSIGLDQYIGIGVDSIDNKIFYSTSENKNSIGINYWNNKNMEDCQNFHVNDSSIYVIGFIKISKFSMSTGIVSGTFQVSLDKPGCQTVNLTNGRFDAKF